MLQELLSDLRYRVRALLERRALDRELNEELRFHLEHETERLTREGLSLEEARRRAAIAFGALEPIKEQSRDGRGVRTVEHLARDLAHSVRTTRRHPAFALIVVLSLALGVGAMTTVLNVSYRILFAPLPLPSPEQLVVLERQVGDDRDRVFSWREYETLRETPGAGTLAATRGASAVSVATGDRRESINVQFVDGAYFGMIGVRTTRGRLITDGDDASGAPVVVLADWFAKRLFADSVAVGRMVHIRGAPFTVVGVTDASYRGLDFPGSFTAAIPHGAVPLLGAIGPGRDNRGNPYGLGDERRTDVRTYQIIGRLAVARAAASSALATTFARCCRATRGEAASLVLLDIRRGVGGGKSDFRGGAGLALAILVGGVLLVLIVVCCNIASLLLVRASARQRELAVRLSLGAPRRRLVQQLLAENATFALLGIVGALVFATWATSAFARSLPPDWADLSHLLALSDWSLVIGVTVGLVAAASGAFALYPAIRATRLPLAGALRLDSRSSRTHGQGIVSRGVVVAQVAVTVMLVSAASLFAATLRNLDRVEGGFDTDDMLLASLETRSTVYEQQGIGGVHDEIVRRVGAVPGVRAVSIATLVPLFGGSNWFAELEIPGRPVSDRLPTAPIVAAIPGHLDAAGIRLVEGRDFTTFDRAGSEPVAIVSEAFARAHMSGGDVVGRTFVVRLGESDPTTVRVVGLAGDARYMDLREPPPPVAYLPLAQTSERWSNAQLVVRCETPLALLSAVTRAVDEAAPGLTVRRVRDMASQRDAALVLERLAARLGAFVSVMALLLSAVGLYGVVAYGVSRRTSEIGIRLALGASRRVVVWMVVRETLAVVAIGVVVGLPLTYASNGALRSRLFGVGAHDPMAMVAAAVLLAITGLLASTIPARRAARVDPRVTLVAD